MAAETNVKQQVREFYDQVGWQMIDAQHYQNAHYEDLRPVSRAYIQRCHLRVGRHLAPEGRFLLDAGSGPIQYPEYLTYSQNYHYRVCADISMVALQEARRRIRLILYTNPGAGEITLLKQRSSSNMTSREARFFSPWLWTQSNTKSPQIQPKSRVIALNGNKNSQFRAIGVKSTHRTFVEENPHGVRS